MTRPYFLYNSFRYLIDAPLLVLAFWIADDITGDSLTSVGGSNYLIFPFLSIIAWYSAAQVSRLYTDLRSNKFAEEIIYIIVTQILFGILLTSFLFFFRNDITLGNY